MKKINGGISLLLAAVALFSLGACKDTGNKGGGGDRFTGELERGATIRIQENGVAIEKGFLADLLKSFNEEYAE